jgi:2-oxoglutarate decarboxylase
MPGQGVIVGVGAMEYPAEFQGAERGALAECGVSKVLTVTSTYDHRIIQGAQSRATSCARIHQLLLGEDDFYDEIFRSLRRPLRAGALAHRQPATATTTTSTRCTVQN